MWNGETCKHSFQFFILESSSYMSSYIIYLSTYLMFYPLRVSIMSYAHTLGICICFIVYSAIGHVNVIYFEYSFHLEESFITGNAKVILLNIWFSSFAFTLSYSLTSRGHQLGTNYY